MASLRRLLTAAERESRAGQTSIVDRDPVYCALSLTEFDLGPLERRPCDG